jgi:hypothetical protein
MRSVGSNGIGKVARPRKISALMLRQIPALIDSGLTAQQIAGMIGCTLGSLRVRCSKSKISLRRKNFCPNGEPRPDGARPSRLFSFHQAERHMTMTLTLPIEMARSLHQTAAAKGLSASTRVTRLLTVIVQDRLCDAVLDEDYSSSRRAA